MSAIPFAIRIPERAIDVVERGRQPRPGRAVFDLQSDVEFTTTALESYAFKSWEPVVYDVFVVAAAIEYGDRIVKRPPLGWARRISLRIPVHNPSRWSAAPVADALHDAIEFLTGDYWTIEFVKRKERAPSLSQSLLPLPVPTEAVIAFSDGMDSRAVAGLIGAALGEKMVLVRLGSYANDRPRTPGKHESFTAVPYRVRSDMPHRETSARSRGFKFATVSGIAAYLTEAAEIVVPESGQGALGPALVTVGHAYPDYRNHPAFMRRMERFLKALLHKDVRYIIPRIWHTKGETLRAFSDMDGSENWKPTRSCWRNNQWSSVNKRRRQCGACAACTLRRMSVHAAGLSEDPETYICSDLTAGTLEAALDKDFTRLNRAFKEYALAGILHMDHLADLAKPDARPQIRRHAAILGPAMRIGASVAEERLTALVGKHAEEWKGFVRSLGPDSFVRQWSRVDQ